MSFKIPKSFELAGQHIAVVHKELLANDTSCDGYAIYNAQEIQLKTGMKPDYEGFVFCHELVHHILNQMGESELRNNEKFVNGFGTFLHQALKTMEAPK